MLLKADSKVLVILSINKQLIIGYILYQSGMESAQFVIEKRDWFDLEMPYYLTNQGPIKLPFSYITVQRSQIEYYTFEIPPQIEEFFSKIEYLIEKKINKIKKSKIDNKKETKNKNLKIIPFKKKS